VCLWAGLTQKVVDKFLWNFCKDRPRDKKNSWINILMNWMGSTIFCLLICDMWKCVSFQYCNALVMNLISMCCSLTLQNNHQHLFYAAQVTWNSLRPVQQISSTASFKYYLNFSTPVGLICLLIHFIFVYLIFYFNTCFCFFFASFLFCFFCKPTFWFDIDRVLTTLNTFRFVLLLFSLLVVLVS